MTKGFHKPRKDCDGVGYVTRQPAMNLQWHESDPMRHNRGRARAGGFGALCTTPSQYGSSLATGLSFALRLSAPWDRDADRRRLENY
jgi:hypothetical protein